MTADISAGYLLTQGLQSLREKFDNGALADIALKAVKKAQSLATGPNILLFGVSYVLLVRVLRFRREASLRAKFGYPDRASLARMTNTEAQQIILALGSYEFPLMQAFSMEYGLFKVYRHIFIHQNCADSSRHMASRQSANSSWPRVN